MKVEFTLAKKIFEKDFDFCHKSESFFVINYVGALKSIAFSKMKSVYFLKKVIAVGLCLTIFLGTPISSYAQEITGRMVSPRFTYIDSYYLSLNAANGIASIYADLESKEKNIDCYIKCNLEKLTGSTYWMQMKSFESTGSGYATLSVDYPIARGTYRVMGVFRCSTETQTGYTGNDTY